MTQTAAKYARVLWELKIPEDVIEESLRIYQQEPVLQKILENPVIYIEKKYEIVDRIFPEQMRNFLKVLCRLNDAGYLEETVEAYRVYANEHDHVLNVELRYVTLPKDEQLKGIKDFLCRKYDAEDVDIHMVKDASLMGGFILVANGQEYDWSLKGRISGLREKLSRR